MKESPAIVIEADKQLVEEARVMLKKGSDCSWRVADIYAELSGKGWTQRKIAEKCGSSQTAVSFFLRCVITYVIKNERPPFWEAYKEVRETQSSSIQGDASNEGTEATPEAIPQAPENPTVAASAQKSKRLCMGCQAKGEQRGCTQCARLNGESAAREPGDDTEQVRAERKEQEAHERDQEGHPLPEALKPPFLNLDKFETLDSLVRQMQKTINELVQLPGGEQLARETRAEGDSNKTIYKIEELNTLKRKIKFTRPHSICPYCLGKANKACHGCNGTGWVSSLTWKGAEDQLKEKLSRV